MLSVEELQQAGELLSQVRDLRTQMEEACDRAGKRKLTTIGGEWPERVECLRRSIARISDIETDIEGVFS